MYVTAIWAKEREQKLQLIYVKVLKFLNRINLREPMKDIAAVAMNLDLSTHARLNLTLRSNVEGKIEWKIESSGQGLNNIQLLILIQHLIATRNQRILKRSLYTRNSEVETQKTIKAPFQ